GLQTGRLRALYGPGGEQAALKLYRKLPGGRNLGRSAREVSDALSALEGKTLDSVAIQAVGPSAYVVSVRADDLELSVRLDRQGPRNASGGVWTIGEKRDYMACLDVEGRDCLVVGGGSVGLEKTTGLLDCGGRVTVVAPAVVPELRALEVELVERRYRSADLQGRFLV